MVTSGSRKGSALLIVLGMLTFMVVSAVAFSAYMRTSRLPSSYLRRVVSSRMLVKAAMAEAIDEIDAAVGDFPHPGVWMKQSVTGTGLSDDDNKSFTDANGKTHYQTRTTENTLRGHNSNAWLGRIYIGGTNDVVSVQERVKDIPQCKTVSTLSLEALAYIPPPLVDEARYYSRHSNAGKWHSMPFESGRYAFCAIDVSDYFDINVLSANEPRSTSPNGRISLAHVFEQEDHTKAGNGQDWDTFVDKILANKVPFVSLADWNLAAHAQDLDINGVKSYFANYVGGGGSHYYGSDLSEDVADTIRQMTFVTDGWFPVESKTASGDLQQDANQPFPKNMDKSSCADCVTYDDIADDGTWLDGVIPLAVKAALFDYLDSDDVPVSLSLPTVERVPMICGIQPEVKGGTIELVCQDNTIATPGSVPGQQTAKRTVKIYIGGTGIADPANAPSASILAVYPFRHEKDPVTVTLDGHMAYFFTYGNMGLRPTSADSALQYKNIEKGRLAPVADGVMGWDCECSAGGVTFPSTTITAEGDAFLSGNDGTLLLEAKKGSTSGSFDPIAGQLDSTYYLLDATFEWDQTQNSAGAWEPDFETAYKSASMKTLKATSGFQALETTGFYDTDPNHGHDIFTKTDKALVDALMGLTDPIELNLNLAIWARFKNKNGKTVDLVPACAEDDDVNGMKDYSQILARFGRQTPLLRFDTGINLKFKLDSNCNLDSKAGVTTAGAKSCAISLSPTAIIARDPRYNYAPENWCAYSVASLKKSDWLSANGAKDADGDIFMQVSNMGKMQSVYELANLPRLRMTGFSKNQAMKGNSAVAYDIDSGHMERPENYSGTSFPASGSEVNAAFMWKTYDPFGRYDQAGNRAASITSHTMEPGGTKECIGDGFELLDVFSDGGGFKVNPYCVSSNILHAVFANTPHSWHHASPDSGFDGSTYFKDHAWNEYSSGAQMYWVNLGEIADRFMYDLRSATPNGVDSRSDVVLNDEDVWEAWPSVFQNLGWYDPAKPTEAQYLLPDRDNGYDNSEYGFAKMTQLPVDLSNTDRKFLYGFWHDCFDVKQQLFLIFVRAEPMLMGGGAVHRQPPQLGARAVALVWRDPKDRSSTSTSGSSSTKGAAPHRTRVLFYRQFD